MNLLSLGKNTLFRTNPKSTQSIYPVLIKVCSYRIKKKDLRYYLYNSLYKDLTYLDLCRSLLAIELEVLGSQAFDCQDFG